MRRWRVTITREDPRASAPRPSVITRVAETPERLRLLVEWCRANPFVVRYRVESFRTLDGEQPTHCSCGARYLTRGSLGRLGWHVCGCGGHFLLSCRACGLVTVEPALAVDCAGLATLVASRERPPRGGGDRNSM